MLRCEASEIAQKCSILLFFRSRWTISISLYLVSRVRCGLIVTSNTFCDHFYALAFWHSYTHSTCSKCFRLAFCHCQWIANAMRRIIACSYLTEVAVAIHGTTIVIGFANEPATKSAKLAARMNRCGSPSSTSSLSSSVFELYYCLHSLFFFLLSGKCVRKCRHFIFPFG